MSTVTPSRIITPAPAIQSLVTHELFDDLSSQGRSVPSPIDRFILNTQDINKLFAVQTQISPALGSLILLGYVSAFESYVRAVIRRIINVDEVAMSLNEDSSVHFGAALHQSTEMLPEALLEGTSFASAKNIKDAIKARLGVKGNFPADVTHALEEFQSICELRHCVVHRFGNLGAKNAIKLGLDEHSELIESSLCLDQQALNDIALIVITVAKTINSFLFDRLVERIATNKADNSSESPYSQSWYWDYRKDKKRFEQYYQIFALTVESAPSPKAFELYSQYRSDQKSA